MSLRLRLVNAYLRWFIRPALARLPTPADARRHFERTSARLPVPRKDVHIAEDSVDGPGGAIPVEWVSCARAERRRILIYLHGGAHIMGSPKTHRCITASLAKATGMRLMVPDFRLAPEHPAPASVQDAVACYSALLAAGYDASGIAFSGESSGGGLGFAALLECQRLGYPPPACIAAFSPWTDVTMEADSVLANAKREVMLPVERAAEVMGYYVGDGDIHDPLISPLFGDYRDPPPVFMTASRAEILLDDATRMAEALRAAGGTVDLHLEDETPHAWPYFAPVLPEGQAVVERTAEFIKERMSV